MPSHATSRVLPLGTLVSALCAGPVSPAYRMSLASGLSYAVLCRALKAPYRARLATWARLLSSMDIGLAVAHGADALIWPVAGAPVCAINVPAHRYLGPECCRSGLAELVGDGKVRALCRASGVARSSLDGLERGHGRLGTLQRLLAPLDLHLWAILPAPRRKPQAASKSP
jgi:hypothetical protein